MCGIAGSIYFQQPQTIQFQLDQILHRGPDARGIFISNDGRLALGHQRLSIIDLSTTANQPFIKDEWVLIFNGEIYNYQTLKKELMQRGANFNTHSDTEVVLEAWRYWGHESLNHFRGMFAFALFNQKTQQLFLARDHFGIKPLFIYSHQNKVAFSSELKGLMPCIEQPSLNLSAIAASLLYVWVPDSQCVYHNVIKFPAGHWAEVSLDGSIAYHSYYQLDQIITQSSAAEASVSSLEAVILDSVRQHLVSDVPVSTFLSGGLDSSLLTIMAHQLSGNIDSYTIAYHQRDQKFESMPDDASYARQLAKQHGIRLHEIELSPNIIQQLPQVVRTLDEPIGDAAAINTKIICEAAHQSGIKVLLSGMGADEIFGGYRKHIACLLAQRYQTMLPRLVREKIVSPLVQKLPVAGRKRGYRLCRWAQRFDNFANLSEESRFLRSYTYYGQQEFSQLLSPDLLAAAQPIFKEHTDRYWQCANLDTVNRMCYTDIHLFMLGLNLTYTDRASMAASTEVRVPFIDKQVVEAAMRIPGRQKIRGLQGKYMLKKVAEKWLPRDIIYRPKAGFGAPLRAWIRHDLREQVDDLVLSQSGLLGRGWLNTKQVRQMVNDDRMGKADYSQQIWQFLTLEIWLREHKVG